MPKISAAIVVYNGAEEAIRAASSVLRYTAAPLTLYLIDNASPDGSGEALRRAAADGTLRPAAGQRVEVLCEKRNLGFGAGHNRVLPLLDSEFHFILNPDILLTQAGTLEGMAAWAAAHPGVVMARPALFFPDGRPQQLPLQKCGVFALLYRQLPQLRALKRFHDRYVMEGQDLSAPTPIEFCTGSFTMIRTDVFRRIGGFDEKYFMYVEDADLTQKARREGTVMLLPQFSAVHAWHRAPHSSAASFMRQSKSMLRYFAKWGVRL